MGPIFILGFPRSGTTAMAQALSGLERFGTYKHEGHFIYLFSEAIDRIVRGDVLALKERELAGMHHEPERGSTIGAARIEIKLSARL